jgi:NRAMP (natural resistance-associated macrophage protein)-like metal ion transporter
MMAWRCRPLSWFRLAGGGAALAFAVALLASGISSSSVGTFAGQVVMEGFLRRRTPVFVRRGVTIVPALAVLAAGVSPADILIFSQVILGSGHVAHHGAIAGLNVVLLCQQLLG